MIQRLRAENILSFRDLDVELGPLNVLIGANGSGKSNLIEVLSILQAAPTEVSAPIRRAGATASWLWKGKDQTGVGRVETVIDFPSGENALRYSLEFGREGEHFVIVREALVEEGPSDSDKDKHFEVRSGRGHVGGREVQFPPSDSVLHQFRDTGALPELTQVGTEYAAIRLYRDWQFGPRTPPRLYQPTDLGFDFLAEDGCNLALVVNELSSGEAGRTVEREFRRFFESFRGFVPKIAGGQVQLLMHEEGLSEPVPATRWSDGMLQYLCLLVILCHPSPPPLICIEEPELGLHPDILPRVAELLKSAAERTQIIITTHSDLLVDEFTDTPEAVVVCERDFDGGTKMRRLDKDALTEWLERYRLGELWLKGEIGGNRW